MLRMLQWTSSFIHFDMHSFNIICIVTLVWPPKELRNRLVARGRKRLCTTGLNYNQIVMSHTKTGWVESFQLEKSFCIHSTNMNQKVQLKEKSMFSVRFMSVYVYVCLCPFSVVGPRFGMASLWRSAHSLEHFQAFLSQLKMVLFGHAGVGSSSEWSPLKRRYTSSCKEWMNKWMNGAATEIEKHIDCHSIAYAMGLNVLQHPNNTPSWIFSLVQMIDITRDIRLELFHQQWSITNASARWSSGHRGTPNRISD